MIEFLFKKLGLEGAILGLWLTNEIAEQFKSEVPKPGQFKLGDKVILTEQDTSYSIGIVEVIYTDTYDIRLIESTGESDPIIDIIAITELQELSEDNIRYISQTCINWLFDNGHMDKLED